MYGYVGGKYPPGTMLAVYPVELSEKLGMWRFALWTSFLEVKEALEKDIEIIESRFAFGQSKERSYDFNSVPFEGTKGYLTYVEKVCALADIYPALSACSAPLTMKDAVLAVMRDIMKD